MLHWKGSTRSTIKRKVQGRDGLELIVAAPVAAADSEAETVADPDPDADAEDDWADEGKGGEMPLPDGAVVAAELEAVEEAWPAEDVTSVKLLAPEGTSSEHWPTICCGQHTFCTKTHESLHFSGHCGLPIPPDAGSTHTVWAHTVPLAVGDFTPPEGSDVVSTAETPCCWSTSKALPRRRIRRGEPTRFITKVKEVGKETKS